MKNFSCFILTLSLVFQAFFACARNVSTYDILIQMDGPVIERFRSGGLSDEIIRGFMDVMDAEADRLNSRERREILEEFFIYLLIYAASIDEYTSVLITLDMRFSDEVTYMDENMRVPPSFEIFFLAVLGEYMQVAESGGATEEPTPATTAPTAAPEPTPTPTPIFSDLEGYEWASDNITSLYNRQIINGYGDGTFNPGGEITRAEFAKLAVEAFLDKSYKMEKSVYSDVIESDWYYRDLLTGEYFSLFQEIYKDNFSPDTPITRQEMCAVAYRAIRRIYLELPQISLPHEFMDFDEISYYAYDPIRELQKAGVINGVGDNRFNPRGTATRAEAVKIVDVLLSFR
jgi:hypothetical protein